MGHRGAASHNARTGARALWGPRPAGADAFLTADRSRPNSCDREPAPRPQPEPARTRRSSRPIRPRPVTRGEALTRDILTAQRSPGAPEPTDAGSTPTGRRASKWTPFAPNVPFPAPRRTKPRPVEPGHRLDDARPRSGCNRAGRRPSVVPARVRVLPGAIGCGPGPRLPPHVQRPDVLKVRSPIASMDRLSVRASIRVVCKVARIWESHRPPRQSGASAVQPGTMSFGGVSENSVMTGEDQQRWERVQPWRQPRRIAAPAAR